MWIRTVNGIVFINTIRTKQGLIICENEKTQTRSF